ncbi:hypothetical protein [Silicimonas algicola]|nr:hypothetical protein [Silicimonas algicola]
MSPLILAAACAEFAYEAPMEGKFDEVGSFAADFALLVNYQQSTFSGVMRNFQFSRSGFKRPDGDVRVTGVVTRGDDDQVLLRGAGQGILTQDDREYLVEVELESFYISEDRTSLSGWYAGGGNFNVSGQFSDWPGIKGRFEADIVCPTAVNIGPCTLPIGSRQGINM